MTHHLRSIFRIGAVSGSVLIGSAFVYSKNKYEEFKERFGALGRLQAMFQSRTNQPANNEQSQNIIKTEAIKNFVVEAKTEQLDELAKGMENMNEEQLRARLEEILVEVIDMQKKQKSRINSLTTENEDLRKEIAGLADVKNVRRPNKRKSLVELYGEILDVLSEYDDTSNSVDSLPRVVVVGDQSSGKTSVLEFIAKARIFPRGSGEMMTRSPVMLTMSEGSKHVASLKNDPKVYNLSSEQDLAELRNKIEVLMRQSVAQGQTISKNVISLSMSGPGIPRMVLVDLPGIINTVTSDMSTDTKDSIISLANSYMANPNSIILCVQDGSVDAERSLVTDLVSSIDPNGLRTVCVLTKLDVAEKNSVKLERIQKLLSGRLFHMKAINFFAVIAGTGDPDSSIAEISEYEDNYFRHSSLFMDGTIKPSQATSHNMISTVSQCFWEMVRASVERQAESFRSQQYALESEWRHNFPNMRELDRDELFERAKGDILEDAIMFSSTTSKEWEKILSSSMWNAVMPFIFKEIYLKHALTSTKIGFQTRVDILIKKWLDNTVTPLSIKVAKQAMMQKLQECFEGPHPKYTDTTYKEMFKPLRDAVLESCSSDFDWSVNNTRNLDIIQKNALSDGSVNDRFNWDQACIFMENVIRNDEAEVDRTLADMLGPSTVSQWLWWQYATPEQLLNQRVAAELSKLLQHRDSQVPKLTTSEISTALQNLHTEGIVIKPEILNSIWDNLYLIHFYNEAINGIHQCRKCFRINDFSQHRLECNDVILFFKVHKLLQQSVSALRQQICSQEARRLENYIKDLLDTYSVDDQKKHKILTGKQVELAVQIKKIAQVRTKLDHFIEALIRESSF